MTDPRARLVVGLTKVAADHVVELECGHKQRRRFRCIPRSVICVECPVPEEWAAQNLRRPRQLPLGPHTILVRMGEAKRHMILRRRTPRVFYLTGADFPAFLATEPPTIRAMFDRVAVEVPGFDGIAVRESKGKGSSTLYCCAGTNIALLRPDA